MKINDFKDRHKGKIGFIIGSGPSVRNINPDKLKDHIVFSVNSSIKKFKDCDYYVCDDWDVINWDYFDFAKKLKCIKLLYRKSFQKYEKSLKLENCIFYSHNEYAINGIVKPNNLKLTKTEPIIGARTVMASAIHLAYIMGCNPIVLVGVDCRYENGKRYFWEFPEEEMCYRKDGKRYNLSIDKSGKDSHCNSFIEYWKYFSKINPDNNIITIKNTSEIKVFKEKTLEEILENVH